MRKELGFVIPVIASERFMKMQIFVRERELSNYIGKKYKASQKKAPLGLSVTPLQDHRLPISECWRFIVWHASSKI